MKIVIIGGHLSPALAVIDELSSEARPGFDRPKDTKILFLGRKYTFEGDRALSLEYKTITRLNIPFVEIATGRWQRSFTKHTIPSFLKLPLGFIKSFFALRSFKPDVVVVFGGYIEVPVVLASFLLHIPIVVHEQTQEAGFANKLAAVLAQKICISFESSRQFFPKSKSIFTGNPVRKFKTQKYLLKRDRPVIYITGGSSGSHFINTMVEGCVKELVKKFIIIHQTGDSSVYRDYDRLNLFRKTFPIGLRSRYILTKFIDPIYIGSVLNDSELVVARAGANTIAELLYFKKPAFLIPLPYSQGKEQVKNALFFKKQGMGEVFKQEELTSARFLNLLLEMFNNIEKYKKNDYQVDKLVNKNAAEDVVKIISNVAKEKKG